MRAITTETIKVNSDDQASGWKQQIPTLAYLNKKRGGGNLLERGGNVHRISGKLREPGTKRGHTRPQPKSHHWKDLTDLVSTATLENRLFLLLPSSTG